METARPDREPDQQNLIGMQGNSVGGVANVTSLQGLQIRHGKFGPYVFVLHTRITIHTP